MKRASFATLSLFALAGCGLFGGDPEPLESKGKSVAQLVHDLPKLETPEVRAAPPTRDGRLPSRRRGSAA